MPHQWLAGGLAGLILGAMIVQMIGAPWDATQAFLLGTIGVLPFVVAVLTVAFLALQSLTAQRTLKNTADALAHARQAEIATRFQKGMELLANSEEATRIGGLYVLRDVVISSPSYWDAVVDSVCPFVQSRCREILDILSAAENLEAQGHLDDEAYLPQTPNDVVVALGVLGQKSQELRAAVGGKTRVVDLEGVALTHVLVEDLNFTHFRWGSGIVADGLTLRRCNFEGNKLTLVAGSVTIDDSNLKSSEITLHAHLYSAGQVLLRECDLNGARLDGGRPVEVHIANCEVDGVRASKLRVSFE